MTYLKEPASFNTSAWMGSMCLKAPLKFSVGFHIICDLHLFYQNAATLWPLMRRQSQVLVQDGEKKSKRPCSASIFYNRTTAAEAMGLNEHRL